MTEMLANAVKWLRITFDSHSVLHLGLGVVATIVIGWVTACLYREKLMFFPKKEERSKAMRRMVIWATFWGIVAVSMTIEYVQALYFKRTSAEHIANSLVGDNLMVLAGWAFTLFWRKLWGVFMIVAILVFATGTYVYFFV